MERECSSDTFNCTLVRRVLFKFMEHLCATPSSVHEKVRCGLAPSHRKLSTSSRLSSAHLSAFSLRNSPLWALILTNMVKRPLLTLWWRTLMMRASISPSGECRRRGSLPPPTHFEATVMSPLESVSLRTTMGWSWERECSRARHAASNSALSDEQPPTCEHCTGCHLPSILLPAPRNQSNDAARSRNPSQSTLAHDAVAAAVSHKHHSIIRVGARLTQFVYDSHSRLAADLTFDKVLFSPWFSWAFIG